MEGDVNWVAAAVTLCGVVAAYYLCVPLLIYGMQRMNGDPKIVLFDIEQKRPPPRVADYFDEAGATLLGLGFEPHPCVGLPDPMPNARAIVQLWTHPERLDYVLVNAVFGVSQENVQRQLYYTEFLSRFESDDVSLIQTNNTTMVGSFPEVPHELAFRFPEVEDIQRLDRLHCKLLDRYAPNARKIIPLYDQHDGDVESYVRWVLINSYRKHVGTGYLVYHEQGNYFRPTVKGAYLMTWAQLWPIKQILLLRKYQRGRLLLRELEASNN